jgi:outer membrane protein assembly factor BamB
VRFRSQLGAFLVAALAAASGVEAQLSWTQWGGPSADFSAPASDLATTWPESGPVELWSRPLGPGYSAILYEQDRLYTMLLSESQESVICLDARTGDTLWQRPYESPPYENQKGYGVGPRSTPLISGDLLFTVGITGEMLALDKSDGKLLWSRNLLGEDFAGTSLTHGYSSSPVAFESLVIVLVGGEDGAIVAFDQDNGRIVWRTQDFRNSYSSPTIVNIAGKEQVLIFMAEELIGLDPANGELLWRYAHSNQWSTNISLPLVADGHLIFLSSPQVGARGLQIEQVDGRFEVEELWSTRRIQFYHASAVLQGDWVFGSSGVTAPSLMAAVNIRTGEIAWRKRGFAKANTVEADGQLVILDEDGVLYLATATPDDLVVRAQTQLLDRLSWTPPTIVGNTLFARDRSRILAVRLGPEPEKASPAG